MSDLDRIDSCVIGAGVVGLAVARQLALGGRKVIVLEQADRFGEGVSSRNSEVIHAGIYYPKGSLKAVLCVRGKQLLYDYCQSRSVTHQRIGKLIVASSNKEDEQLETILAQARGNGVDDLVALDTRAIEAMEPAISATSALLSPSTGIVNAAELMTSLLGDLEAEGGSLACHARLRAARKENELFTLDVDIEGEFYQFQCRELINSAGLGAQEVAGSIEDFPAAMIPPLFLCKGNYFLMQGKNPFNHLIYPVPEQGGTGLGVHATIDTGGQVKFGPDVEYISEPDYRVSTDRHQASYEAIRRYFPALKADALVPGYAGIRPKIQGPGQAPRDFEIQDECLHGIPGLVNLFGIESPGLTSSMAIAETVAESLGCIQ